MRAELTSTAMIYAEDIKGTEHLGSRQLRDIEDLV